tara:strand:- start:2 stop:925 length:924 start_codon:yes stop_codon:yes gene_type:complete
MALKVSITQSTAQDGAAVVASNTTGDGTSLNSIEQFLSPVQIQKGHPGGASTPGFRAPIIGWNEFGRFSNGSIAPTVDELCPYFPQILDADGSKFMEANDYRIVAHDTGGDYNLLKFASDGGDRKNINAVRVNGLRGPLILSGWGYGLDDFPVPQEGSAYPQKKNFDGGLAHDRAKWKSGPVHLMWDDERQVWAGGYPIVCGVALDEITAPVDVCSPTSFSIRLLRNTQHLGGKLSDVTDEVLMVKNRDPSLEQDFKANAIFVMAIKLNYEWIPLWVGCPEVAACGDEEKGEPDVPACISTSACMGI